MAVVEFDRDDRVATARINRPDAMNALNDEVMSLLVEQCVAWDADESVGCIVITGNDRAFAAGADIAELQARSAQDMFTADVFAEWDRFAALRTPTIAAVSGYALGGGCELAMMCDIILASDTAKFGQPEIKLGLTPGMGGTQRLTRLVGRTKATELILTGRMVKADEAERIGLATRVVAAAELWDDAMTTARTIAGFSAHTARVACEMIDTAERSGLDDGLRFERRSYYALFDTPDAHEGMTAFLEKRDADFNRRPNAQEADN